MASKKTRQRKGRPPRLIAFGFLFAFGLSILTLIYTGLLVRAPGSGRAPDAWEPAARTAVPETPRAEPGETGRDDHAPPDDDAGDAAAATATGRDADSSEPED